jgi:hypothetical protein
VPQSPIMCAPNFLNLQLCDVSELAETRSICVGLKNALRFKNHLCLPPPLPPYYNNLSESAGRTGPEWIRIPTVASALFTWRGPQRERERGRDLWASARSSRYLHKKLCWLKHGRGFSVSIKEMYPITALTTWKKVGNLVRIFF